MLLSLCVSDFYLGLMLHACVKLTSIHGNTLKLVSKCHYLGVYFTSGRTFKCSYDSAKASFVRALMLSRVKPDVLHRKNVLTLFRAKCLHAHKGLLLYATEAYSARA